VACISYLAAEGCGPRLAWAASCMVERNVSRSLIWDRISGGTHSASERLDSVLLQSARHVDPVLSGAATLMLLDEVLARDCPSVLLFNLRIRI